MTTAAVTNQDLAAFEASLPPAPKPVASYVPSVQVGDLVFTSGMLPMAQGAVTSTGQFGSPSGPDLDAGKAAAELCLKNALAVVRDQVGSLSNIKQVVKLTVYVSSSPDFTQQPQVANGASDLLVQVFGEAGKHARAAVGVASLPLGASVELDLVVQV
jgi:enamine deaminase RidA (YjgF/YER057c/UK114 family)